MFCQRQYGGINILVIVMLLSLILFASLAIDMARLVYQKQALQSAADMAALQLSRTNPYFLDQYAVEADLEPLKEKYKGSGQVDTLVVSYGSAKIENNRWVFDINGEDGGYSAAQVVVTKTVPKSMVAGGFIKGDITLTARAAIQKSGLVRFGIGTGLLALDTADSKGIVSRLTQLLGLPDSTLSVADYNGLLNSNIQLDSVLKNVALKTSLATAQEALGASISVSDLLTLYAQAISENADAAIDIEAIKNKISVIAGLSVVQSLPDIKMSDLISLVGDTNAAALSSTISALDLLKTTIQIANKDHAIDLDATQINLAGLASIKASATVISPAKFVVSTLPVKIGSEPWVENSQVDVNLSAKVLHDDLLSQVTNLLSTPLLGLDLSIGAIEISAQGAYAKATLVDTGDFGNGQALRFNIEKSLGLVTIKPIDIDVKVIVLILPITVKLRAAITVTANNSSTPRSILLQDINSQSGPYSTAIDDFDPVLIPNVELELLPGQGLLSSVLSLVTTILNPVLKIVLGDVVGNLVKDALVPVLSSAGVQLGPATLMVDVQGTSQHGLIQ